MQTSFTDLVGTAVVPAHCFDSAELTDLSPALGTTTVVHGLTAQAGEAANTHCSWCPQELEFGPVTHASEARASWLSYYGC